MSQAGGNDPYYGTQYDVGSFQAQPPIQAEVVPERRSRPLLLLPLVLFLATCWTTYSIGEQSFENGLLYSAPLMTILLCHEFGHYLQARRYHVPASLPLFIPIPARPFGTMGAVIAMRGNTWDRRALFDIGISGPLAGLVPALIFTYVGLTQSEVVDIPPARVPGESLGAPIIVRLIVELVFGQLPAGKTVDLGPLAYAGWVGIFITALNLIPIGQLDGGHVLYALLRRKANLIASVLLMLAIAAVIITQTYTWLIMLFLLVLIGPNHPPTANDTVPLGTTRIILGWLTLAFVIIGFTPRPFM
jgi:membrane-associated protease RseP (regulator of RpoE activity)